MTEAVDHLIPVSLIISRLEKHRDEMQSKALETRWWQWRRRTLLLGAAGAYSYEIEQILGITGSWQPIWDRKK